ncbi:MAG: hypothetical protein ABI588_02015 [Arenimonas sp.]
MNIQWKEIGQLASPRRWSAMAWGVILTVLACSIGAAVVGVELYQVTGRQVIYNAQ